MQSITNDELTGLFESIEENDEKIQTQQGIIKMTKADTEARFKEFAKEKEVDLKDLKDSYSYYKERKDKGESAREDYFTLCASIDSMEDDTNANNSQGK